MKLLRSKPSPALAVSITALVVALGGTSYAAVKIGSEDIKNNTIQSKDIQDKGVKGRDLAKDSMNRGKIKKNAVVSPKVKDGSLRARDLRADQLSRWVLINSAGQIEAQSGGFSVTAGYPALPSPGNGNVYINANEPLTDNGIVASIALQNTVEQDGNANTNGRAPGPDANAEFSGEISVSQCAPTGTSITNCAPEGTNNINHFVVSPRNSDGSFTTDGTRKRFYVVITGDSKDRAFP